jgi:hypothetical protein
MTTTYLPSWAYYQEHRYYVLVLDNNGNIVDIPQADVESVDVEQSVNGGSGQGTIVFRRDYNSIGQLAYGYYVLVWFWRGSDDPTRGVGYQEGGLISPDPWYAGYISDIDDKMMETDGQVTCKLEGVMKLLDRAIVTETINPGVDGNPGLSASTYLTHLLTTYQPPFFGPPSIPSGMPNLSPNQFDGTKLGAAIDTVVKQVRDTSGLLYTWFVRPTFNLWGLSSGPNIGKLGLSVVVQVDQNPNVVSGATFKNIFVRAQAASYKVQTKYRDLVNVIAIYGGQDPITGQQVYGVYQDPVSVATYGAIEDKLFVPYLQSSDACQAYATNYLDLHAYPQAQGEIELLDPDPTLVAGKWVQCFETASPSVVQKQVRASNVRVAIKGERVDQTVSTVSPVPYLDQAIYRMGLHAGGQTATAIKRISVDYQNLFVRQGGAVTSTSSSPPTVTVSSVTTVFPSGMLTAPAATLTLPANDGAYTIVHDQPSNTLEVVSGDVAASPTQMPIASVTAVAGTPYTADRRVRSVNIEGVNSIISQSGTLNLVIPSGTAFPGSPAAESLFYRSDQNELYIYNGTLWVPVGPYSVASGTAFPASPSPQQLFYRSDQGVLYIYSGTAWLAVGPTTLTAGTGITIAGSAPNYTISATGGGGGGGGGSPLTPITFPGATTGPDGKQSLTANGASNEYVTPGEGDWVRVQAVMFPPSYGDLRLHWQVGGVDQYIYVTSGGNVGTQNGGSYGNLAGCPNFTGSLALVTISLWCTSDKTFFVAACKSSNQGSEVGCTDTRLLSPVGANVGAFVVVSPSLDIYQARLGKAATYTDLL